MGLHQTMSECNDCKRDIFSGILEVIALRKLGCLWDGQPYALSPNNPLRKKEKLTSSFFFFSQLRSEKNKNP
jgi:hypothetical protein